MMIMRNLIKYLTAFGESWNRIAKMKRPFIRSVSGQILPAEMKRAFDYTRIS
jgi:hypothetical protein